MKVEKSKDINMQKNIILTYIAFIFMLGILSIFVFDVDILAASYIIFFKIAALVLSLTIALLTLNQSNVFGKNVFYFIEIDKFLKWIKIITISLLSLYLLKTFKLITKKNR